MSVLTSIAGIPLYSTAQEAAAWARANGLIGYHTHGWQGQIGYMGGASHEIAVQGPITTPTPISIPIPTTTPVPEEELNIVTTTTTTTTTTGGGGGAGGGGGY